MKKLMIAVAVNSHHFSEDARTFFPGVPMPRSPVKRAFKPSLKTRKKAFPISGLLLACVCGTIKPSSNKERFNAHAVGCTARRNKTT